MDMNRKAQMPKAGDGAGAKEYRTAYHRTDACHDRSAPKEKREKTTRVRSERTKLDPRNVTRRRLYDL
jgi:hypothetical protein